MNLLIKLAIYFLEGLFVFGVLGAFAVVLATTVEDFGVLLGKEEGPPSFE